MTSRLQFPLIAVSSFQSHMSASPLLVYTQTVAWRKWLESELRRQTTFVNTVRAPLHCETPPRVRRGATHVNRIHKETLKTPVGIHWRTNKCAMDLWGTLCCGGAECIAIPWIPDMLGLAGFANRYVVTLPALQPEPPLWNGRTLRRLSWEVWWEHDVQWNRHLTHWSQMTDNTLNQMRIHWKNRTTISGLLINSLWVGKQTTSTFKWLWCFSVEMSYLVETKDSQRWQNNSHPVLKYIYGYSCKSTLVK